MKLAKLPNRSAVKLTVSFPHDIYEALRDYTRFYAKAYGEEEKLEELVPYITAAFLDSDTAFKKARKRAAEKPRPDKPAALPANNSTTPAPQPTIKQGDNPWR